MRPFSRILDRAVVFSLDRLERLSAGRCSAAPLCKAPLGSDAEYLRRWHHAREAAYPAVDEFERACGAAIDP